MRGISSTFILVTAISVMLISVGSWEATTTNGNAAPQVPGSLLHHSSSSSSSTTSSTSTSSSATSSSTTSSSSSSSSTTSSGDPSFAVEYSVPVGAFPLTGAYDPSNHLLYVVDQNFAGLTAINGSNWAHTFTVCTGTGAIASADLYDPSNDDLYVACSSASSDYVAVVNPGTAAVIATVPMLLPQVLAYDPANGDVYVGNGNVGSTIGPVSVISSTTNQVVATISGAILGPNEPNQIIYDAANHDVYVTNNNSPNYLTVINGVSNTFITNIQLATVGGGTAGAAIYDPANGDVLVHAPLQAGTDSVKAIGTSNAIVATITPGCGSGGDEPQFAYDPVNGNVYCGTVHQGPPTTNQVCEISSSPVAYVGCVNTSSAGSLGIYGQSYLVFDPANGDVYVAGGGPDNSNTAPPPETIEVVSCSSLTLLKTISIPGVPFQLSFDPANNQVYAGVPQTGSPQFNIMVPVSS